MVGYYNQGVPTSVDLENHSNHKKYTVNRGPNGLIISKPLCTLMAIGAIILAILAGLLVFFLVPRCSEASPSALVTRTESGPGEVSNDFTSTENGKNTLGDYMDEIDERLPRSIAPSHYRLRIAPNFSNLTTNGTVSITLDAKEETYLIILHVKDIEIDKSSVEVKSVKSNSLIQISDQEYISGQKYKITLDKPLVKNEVYTLLISFSGYLNRHLQGFYRSDYTTRNGTSYLASTQFSPTDARRAFPCFDEPSFKATFTISVARPGNMTSISNMPLEKIEPFGNGWFWNHYAETPKMSTYLVGFVVSDLQSYDSLDKLIKVWSRQDLIDQTSYAAEFAPKVLHFFEDYFKIAFPLPKIDIVAIPDFGFSAMENWGLITFRESALLYDTQQSDVDNKRDIATILAHELGHQWFGNLVTPKWWNDLWLKEGFATYLQYLGANFAEPTWNIDDEFIITETIKSFSLDALESSRSLSFDVHNSQQIRQTFDELSYGKGACIIRMMNHFLGEETFKAGLISFLEKYKYTNANRQDLFEALTQEAHKTGALDQSVTVKDIMDTWTKQPGFPVITAIADHSNRKLIISQKRFLYTNGKDQSTWWVPISITTDANLNFTTKPALWLKNEPMVTVDLNFTQWYILNIYQTGYYIVNYDEANWRLLSENIMNLPPIIRAQLISDSMDLARANLLDYDIPLKLIARMAVRDDKIMFVPTMVAFKKLAFLNDILSTTSAFGLFEEFHASIFKKTYEIVDSNKEYYSDNYLQQRIRKAVLEWSCRRSNSECAIKAQHMFRNWMQRNIEVPANLRHNVYCTAIREGTEAEWNFAYDQYLATNSVSEKNVLLDALGCTTKRWLLSRYLNFLLQNNTSIRIQDADRVFESVSDNSMTNSLAFDFLRMNWDKLLEHFGEGFNVISKMVKNLPRYMNTEYQLSELIRFKKEVKNNIGAANQAFDFAIERVRGNVEWMKKNYKSVEKWFSLHKYHYNVM